MMVHECNQNFECSIKSVVHHAMTLLLENWVHRFQTDAMPGDRATTTTAERASHQAGDWSLGVQIGRSYMIHDESLSYIMNHYDFL